jgi:hypothetical protein
MNNNYCSRTLSKILRREHVSNGVDQSAYLLDWYLSPKFFFSNKTDFFYQQSFIEIVRLTRFEK